MQVVGHGYKLGRGSDKAREVLQVQTNEGTWVPADWEPGQSLADIGWPQCQFRIPLTQRELQLEQKLFGFCDQLRELDRYDPAKTDYFLEGLQVQVDQLLEEETEDERERKWMEAQIRDYEAEHEPIGEGEEDEDDLPF